jgi:aminopeptidase N
MRPETPPTISLKDYQPTAYGISHADLTVSLDAHETVTYSRLTMTVRRPGEALILDGEGLKLLGIDIDGQALGTEAYTYDGSLLTIRAPTNDFVLTIRQSCNPSTNTALSGLYISNGMFCTQMEAEGFRRFAFYYDRPDVMATFTVRLEAPKTFPVLLANGNPGESGDIAGTDRHFAVWHDPHPKPCYLFALVAGDLAPVTSHFTTTSGRKVKLGVYVEKGKEDRCEWAMESIKASMRWDEERFGREYDLDQFNVVAVSSFNMGAMENKGLNIFNDKYVLARPDTATDSDYINIEAIIAHEYFHNWTGNRITCRDWFQLCLKEGLTVFRDQEFTADRRSRAVKRIQDVAKLRARQFPEDQGPLAHPVRPSHYIEINNFYTPTIYEKGAELCRMMQTLIGPSAFRKAMDLYFERHDGEAAIVEDFVRCMADASGRDLSQFFRWYEQAGTPVVTVNASYDAKAGSLRLDLSQQQAPTPGQAEKLPLHIPLRIGLLGQDGTDVPLLLNGKGAVIADLIELTEPSQSFTFTGLTEKPVVSINRGFTAPVVLQSNDTEQALLFQMAHDRDGFNRWEAAQGLARALITTWVKNGPKDSPARRFGQALGQVLLDPSADLAFKALMLALPQEAEIAASIGGDADADAIFSAREHLRAIVAGEIRHVLQNTYDATQETGRYRPNPEGTGRRALRYAALSLIAAIDPAAAVVHAQQELSEPSSMTAELGALNAILAVNRPERDALISAFHARHRDDHLLIDKWLLLNAQIPGNDAHQRIAALMNHPDFKLTVPNRVYALIGGFTGNNLTGFNAAHGEGYRIAADAILALDGSNPQVAARTATAFRSWKIFDLPRRAAARAQMERILQTKPLSRDVFEIISRTLIG